MGGREIDIRTGDVGRGLGRMPAVKGAVGTRERNYGRAGRHFEEHRCGEGARGTIGEVQISGAIADDGRRRGGWAVGEWRSGINITINADASRGGD